MAEEHGRCDILLADFPVGGVLTDSATADDYSHCSNAGADVHCSCETEQEDFVGSHYGDVLALVPWHPMLWSQPDAFAHRALFAAPHLFRTN